MDIEDYVTTLLFLIFLAFLLGFLLGVRAGRDTTPAPRNTIARDWHSAPLDHH